MTHLNVNPMGEFVLVTNSVVARMDGGIWSTVPTAPAASGDHALSDVAFSDAGEIVIAWSARATGTARIAVAVLPP